MTKHDPHASQLRRQSEAARALLAQIADGDEDLRHDMVEGETSLVEAVSAALCAMDECDATIAGCKDREETFAKRRASAERRKETLRTLIQQAIEVSGLETVKAPTGTATVKAVAPKPIISDESMIPAAYWKQPNPVLDKKAINDAVKGGEEIPGVTISNGGTTIQIRRA